MFNSFLTFGEENLGVEERKGKKRNDFEESNGMKKPPMRHARRAQRSFNF